MTDPIRTALAPRTNAVAYLALTVALEAPTAYAADKLVGPRNLAKNAVRGKHVKDGSLAAADFAPGALGRRTGTGGTAGSPGTGRPAGGGGT